MFNTSPLTRRTFIGSLLASVPGLNVASSLIAFDPVIETATLWHLDKELISSTLSRSGRVRCWFRGHEMVRDESGMYRINLGDCRAAIDIEWRSPTLPIVKSLSVLEPWTYAAA